MQKTNALSFKELKQRISLEHVLRHYNLFDGLQLRGKSHRGPCPFCEVTEGNSFSVSLEKNCYQCFTCKASGNILDFVSKWEGVNIREAGQVLAKNFVAEKAPHTCSGSTTVGVWLANGGQFRLTLCDNGLSGRLTLSANGLTLTDKGSPTAQPAHAQ